MKNQRYTQRFIFIYFALYSLFLSVSACEEEKTDPLVPQLVKKTPVFLYSKETRLLSEEEITRLWEVALSNTGLSGSHPDYRAGFRLAFDISKNTHSFELSLSLNTFRELNALLNDIEIISLVDPKGREWKSTLSLSSSRETGMMHMRVVKAIESTRASLSIMASNRTAGDVLDGEWTLECEVDFKYKKELFEESEDNTAFEVSSLLSTIINGNTEVSPNPPQPLTIGEIDDQRVVAGGAIKIISITATDTEGDAISFFLSGNPPNHVTLVDNGGGSGVIRIDPSDLVASEESLLIAVLARAAGKTATETFTLTVTKLLVKKIPVFRLDKETTFLDGSSAEKLWAVAVSNTELSGSHPDYRAGFRLAFDISKNTHSFELSLSLNTFRELNALLNDIEIISLVDPKGREWKSTLSLSSSRETGMMHMRVVKAIESTRASLSIMASNRTAGDVLDGEWTLECEVDFKYKKELFEESEDNTAFEVSSLLSTIINGNTEVSPNPPQPLTIGEIDDQRVVAGGAIKIISITATDTEGDAISFFLSGNPPNHVTLVDNGGGSGVIRIDPSDLVASEESLLIAVLARAAGKTATETFTLTVTKLLVKKIPVFRLDKETTFLDGSSAEKLWAVAVSNTELSGSHPDYRAGFRSAFIISNTWFYRLGFSLNTLRVGNALLDNIEIISLMDPEGREWKDALSATPDTASENIRVGFIYKDIDTNYSSLRIFVEHRRRGHALQEGEWIIEYAVNFRSTRELFEEDEDPFAFRADITLTALKHVVIGDESVPLDNEAISLSDRFQQRMDTLNNGQVYTKEIAMTYIYSSSFSPPNYKHFYRGSFDIPEGTESFTLLFSKKGESIEIINLRDPEGVDVLDSILASRIGSGHKTLSSCMNPSLADRMKGRWTFIVSPATHAYLIIKKKKVGVNKLKLRPLIAVDFDLKDDKGRILSRHTLNGETHDRANIETVMLSFAAAENILERLVRERGRQLDVIIQPPIALTNTPIAQRIGFNFDEDTFPEAAIRQIGPDEIPILVRNYSVLTRFYVLAGFSGGSAGLPAVPTLVSFENLIQVQFLGGSSYKLPPGITLEEVQGSTNWYYVYTPEGFGETIAHEVGHSLGLYHPVELLGDIVGRPDVLADTPLCPGSRSSINDPPCGNYNNLMHYRGNGNDVFLTPNQVEVILAHPYVYTE